MNTQRKVELCSRRNCFPLSFDPPLKIETKNHQLKKINKIGLTYHLRSTIRAKLNNVASFYWALFFGSVLFLVIKISTHSSTYPERACRS